ncbi:MAG: NADAR family protein [Ignavibacteriae bacterium]|nr:NADAR family protein [Ignavibacteriota bacterium]
MQRENYNERKYLSDEVVIFKKTKELYGGLSNMASGFPIVINGITILTSEALYQACRFPHLPELQKQIIKQKSPMSAKMVTKPFRNQSRGDWDSVRVSIMRWCLRVKLAQNYIEFGKLLESTFNKPIVEDSRRDNFWGALRDKNNNSILLGENVLGRLLMELRQKYNQERYSPELLCVKPLNITDFKLLGEPIQMIDEREHFIRYLGDKLGCSLLLSSRHSLEVYTSKESSLTQKGSILPISIELNTEGKIIPLRKKKQSQEIRKKDNIVASDISLFR